MSEILTYNYSEYFKTYPDKDKKKSLYWLIFFSILYPIILFIGEAKKRGPLVIPTNPWYYIIMGSYCSIFIFYLPYYYNKVFARRIEEVRFSESSILITCSKAYLYKTLVIACNYSDLEILKGVHLEMTKSWKRKDVYFYEVGKQRRESEVYTICSRTDAFPKVLLVVDFFENNEQLVAKLLSV